LSPKPQNWPDSLAGTLVGGVGAPGIQTAPPGAKARPARRALIVASLLVMLVVLGLVAPPLVKRTQDEALVASMKTDLRNLVTAQEAFFADSVRYGSLSEIRLHGYYTPSYSVDIQIEAWSGTGWRAVATRYDTARRCYIWIGSYGIPGVPEGEAYCTSDYVPPPAAVAPRVEPRLNGLAEAPSGNGQSFPERRGAADCRYSWAVSGLCPTA
jgi:hypothetical protein